MKGRDSVREPRLSELYYSIIFICSFFTCKYIFSYDICRFTHISLKALNFLHFIPLFYGSTSSANFLDNYFLGA